MKKPVKQQAEWEIEFDESELGDDIAWAISAACNEFHISSDQCQCEKRYDQLKSFISRLLEEREKEAFEKGYAEGILLDKSVELRLRKKD